jgi:HSP20 family protein
MAKESTNPLQDLVTIRDRMNRLFEESLGRFTSLGEPSAAGYWSPAVDIFEDTERVVFRVDLPGIRREDVELNIEDGNLVLRGERRMNPDVRREDYHRLERAFGPFLRSFRLPEGVDPQNIQAEMRDGVLTVSIPRREDSHPRRVQIQVE